eukprot:10440927-Prorocentrum_lima.AAC.1
MQYIAGNRWKRYACRPCWNARKTLTRLGAKEGQGYKQFMKSLAQNDQARYKNLIHGVRRKPEDESPSIPGIENTDRRR